MVYIFSSVFPLFLTLHLNGRREERKKQCRGLFSEIRVVFQRPLLSVCVYPPLSFGCYIQFPFLILWCYLILWLFCSILLYSWQEKELYTIPFINNCLGERGRKETSFLSYAEEAIIPKVYLQKYWCTNLLYYSI